MAESKPAAGKDDDTDSTVQHAAVLTDEAPVVTKHRITVDGKALAYSVTTGRLPLKNDKGEIEANVFYMAYTLDGVKDPARRPLMFSFNGGPGSSSVWLHLGALGPRRVKMLPDGGLPPAPYQLVDNPHTWLTESDIVFVDPVGTGYSRAADPELGKKFWSLKGDIESLGEFIRLYLTRSQRWLSPLYIVGESYGTTRSAGLSAHLIDRGIALNGILLVSSVLNFQTLSFDKGNDLPYQLFLPSYSATAWFHKRLGQRKSLPRLLREAEDYADNGYATVLAKGDRLSSAERASAVETLSNLTALSPEFIEHCDLRIEQRAFCKELLRHERRSVGRLDSRFKGIEASGVTDKPDFDPSMSAIRPPYTAALNDYLRRGLKYETDMPYFILGGGFEKWDWGSAEDGAPDTSEALRTALAKNPHMRVWVASGYYDLATPYHATTYTLSHLGLDPSLRRNFSTADYEAGHMMYISEPCLAQFKQDSAEFIRQSA